jgi:hypothetical protein
MFRFFARFKRALSKRFKTKQNKTNAKTEGAERPYVPNDVLLLPAAYATISIRTATYERLCPKGKPPQQHFL